VTRLVVWRHGRTAWNSAGRFQGQTDIPLDGTGVAQAAAAAELLARLQPTAIVTSDLRRAADTAAALAERTGLPVKTDARLRERGFGEWEGLTQPEIQERWPEALAQWRALAPIQGCGIEPVEDLDRRVTPALRDAAEQAPDGLVVVATHGGAGRRGIAGLLELPDAGVRTLGNLHNCHWCELRLTSRGWRLQSYNVGPHAEPAAGG